MNLVFAVPSTALQTIDISHLNLDVMKDGQALTTDYVGPVTDIVCVKV